MLVLSRKVNEQIVLGGGTVIITVVGIRDDKVRIGIDAPIEMSVHRREVQDVIDRQSVDRQSVERQSADDQSNDSGDGIC